MGDDAGVKEYIGDATEVIDLNGQMVTPGFISGHDHVGSELGKYTELSLFDLDPDIEVYKAAIEQYIADNPDMKVYNISKMSLKAFEGGLATNDWLNEISEDKFIVVGDESGHGCLVNDIRLDENKMGGDISIPATMTLEYAADDGSYNIMRIEGVPYYTIEYIFASATSTYHNGYNLNIWADNAPEGCIFTDMDNNRLSTGRFQDRDVWVLPTENKETSLNDNGDEHSGKAKLCIPVDNAPNKGEIKVNCGGSVMQYDIYLAYNEVYYEQSYIIADPSEGILTANVSLNWGSDITEKGKLQVLKVNGSGQPLAGATIVFEKIDGSFTTTRVTDHAGMIQLTAEDLPIGSYKVYERAAPEGYEYFPSTYSCMRL